MAKTVEDIENIVKERENRMKSINQEYAKTDALFKAATAAADEAAAAGNLEEYEAKQKEASEAERKKAFLRIQLSKIQASPNVDMDAAKEAWAAFAEKYNKEMKTMHAEYEAQKNALCELYWRMIDRQFEMIHMQQRMNKCVNTSTDNTKLFPAYRLPCMRKEDAERPAGMLSAYGTFIKDPDALFAISHYRTSNEQERARAALEGDKMIDKMQYVLTGVRTWIK